MSSVTALVGIGICTYCRPYLLKKALLSLNEIEVPQEVNIHLLVVDNDPLRSAEHTIRALSMRYPTSYQVVAGGRVEARNTVLETFVKQNTRYIALCDDDAQVSRQWLTTLYKYLHLYQADVITDYIRVRLPSQAPTWLRTNYEALLYIRPPVSVRQVAYARTGNVLFKTTVCEQLRFDPRYQTYGEDTDFFLRAHKAGAHIYELNAFLITESWSLARASLTFLMQRQYRIGVMSTLIFYKVLKINGLLKICYILLKKIFYAPLHPFFAWFRSRDLRKHALRIYFTQSLLLLIRSIGYVSGFFKIFTLRCQKNT